MVLPAARAGRVARDVPRAGGGKRRRSALGGLPAETAAPGSRVADRLRDPAPHALLRASAGGAGLPQRPLLSRRRRGASQQSARRHGDEWRHPRRLQHRGEAGRRRVRHGCRNRARPLRAPAPAGGARIREYDYHREQAQSGGARPGRARSLEERDEPHRRRSHACPQLPAQDFHDCQPEETRVRLALLLLCICPALTAAQGFPARQISIMVPYPPGSTSDLIPRVIAPLMSQSLGVAVIVENRPGAGGNVGAAAVAKGDASGHQLLMAPSAILATNQWLYKDLGYDPQKDLIPVINAATTPNMWVAHPQVEARTIADVLAAARAKPGALAFASGGNGTTGHLCGELLKTTARVDLL